MRGRLQFWPVTNLGVVRKFFEAISNKKIVDLKKDNFLNKKYYEISRPITSSNQIPDESNPDLTVGKRTFYPLSYINRIYT